MKTCAMLALAAALFLLPQVTRAASGSPKPLFASHDVVHLTIRAPLGRIVANAADSKEAFDGTITEDGGSTPLAVRLSPRGISRRQADVCSFPPLRVEFADKPPETSLFRGQKKLKLVTHCQGTVSFQQYLLLEYGAYRLFNAMTPQSFQVRLVKIDYVDSSGRPFTSRLGFFIEAEKDLAKRNGLEESETGDRIPAAALQPAAAAREAMFQYMIGNLDWAMTAGPPGSGCCHNTKLIGPGGAATGLIPTPYDFDSSGLVDPPYAVVPPGVAASNVRERHYRGYCIHNPEAQAAAAEMLARRAALSAVFDDIPGLEDRTRRNALAYLGGFFDQIGTEKSVSDKLLRYCLR